jgi:hypothetical protein
MGAGAVPEFAPKWRQTNGVWNVMMDSERLFERIDEYRQALARLRDALNKPQDEYMRDAVIQRFEFTYELAWKAINYGWSSKKLKPNIQKKPCVKLSDWDWLTTAMAGLNCRRTAT